MNLPKLFQKKNEGTSGKVQGIDTARKAQSKPAALKAARPKKPETTKKVSGKPSLPSVWVNTTRDYLREVVFELRKVVWPSRKETVGTTAVVLVIVGLCASFLGIIDFVLSRMVRLVVG
jgi:preprotein translocase subunit SecE